jgi:hypothetical protein
MARISTYQKDLTVSKFDKVIGTDSSGSVTKNFTLEDIGNFFTQTNAVGAISQLVFKFTVDAPTAQTVSFELGGGNNTTFDNVSEIRLSSLDVDNNDLSQYLEQFQSHPIIIVRLDDFSNFGIFEVDNVFEAGLANFKMFGLTNRVNQGSFIDGKYYGIAIFPINADKNYTHTQSSASSTWTINHNLNKFGSVTVVLSTGQKGYGDVTYIDSNSLTVSFAGAETGKAYIN